MANLVTYDQRPDLQPLQMSNGLTSVFVSVLALAASSLARNDRQREFAVWFASHDQSVFGSGVVGFDVSELPWCPKTFVSDRAFLLDVVAAAKAKTAWEKLGYAPREDWVLDRLEGFGAMVSCFDIRDAADPEQTGWAFGERPTRFELCPAHALYRHSEGCVICNES